MTPTTNHAGAVRDYVVTNFLFGEAGDLKDETSFMGSGIIDSTGILELIMFIEETYAIKVQPEEMLPENFDSVDRVAAFISRKLARSAVPSP